MIVMRTSQRQEPIGFGAYCLRGFLFFALPLTIWSLLSPSGASRRLELLLAVPSLIIGTLWWGAAFWGIARLARKLRQDQTEQGKVENKQTPEL
jgi:hypothetical protein